MIQVKATSACPRCGAPGAERSMRMNHSVIGGGRGMGGGGRGVGGFGSSPAAAAAATGPGAAFNVGFDYPERTAHRTSHMAQIRSASAATQQHPLTQDERDDLLLLREEEKIARDVYIRLFEQWGIRPFDNISGAEQAHMDAILALLQHHGLPDPAQGLSVGQFRSPALQALYEQLVEQGLRSQADGIRVGLLIEELDIADLQKSAKRTRKPEILAVYAELERGSRNHLRAFYRWKVMLGIDYQPQHLPVEEFVRTALSAHENCE